MTNHPRRRRDGENDEPSIEEIAVQAAAETPVVRELAAQLEDERIRRSMGQSGPDGPPVHTPNGTGEAFKPNAAELIGSAAGKHVAKAIADALPQALASVLMQVPVRLAQWFKCATCVSARVAWCAAHQDDLTAAEAMMIAVTGQWAPDDPRRGQVNPLMFLPQELQPQPGPPQPGSSTCPNVVDGAVMMNGTVYCGDHLPGIAQAGGRKEFLIANAPLSSALIAEVMGQGQAAA